jgi:hypothetical protein
MSAKDDAIGRLVRLLDRCDTASVVRLADEVEECAEIGIYGVCSIPQDEPRLPRARSAPFEAASEHAGPYL